MSAHVDRRLDMEGANCEDDADREIAMKAALHILGYNDVYHGTDVVRLTPTFPLHHDPAILLPGHR